MNGHGASEPAQPLVVRGRGFLLGSARGAGGLLVRCDDGAAFALNRSAAFVWRLHLQGGSADEVAAALSARFAIALERAREDVAAALRMHDDGAGRGAADAPAAGDGARGAGTPRAWVQQRPYVYERIAGGYRLGLPGLPLFDLDADGAGLTWAGGAPGGPGEPCPQPYPAELLGARPGEPPVTLEGHLWIAAPRLLALRGHTVLHAAAVGDRSGARLLLGDSGAGKSTTARAFAAAGLARLCDDKLVLSADGDGLLAVEGELRRWCREVAAAIRAGTRRVPAPVLAPQGQARATPIAALYFVAADQRRPGSAALEARPMPEGSALAWAFQQGFLGSFDPAEWESRLRLVTALCARAQCLQLFVPDGLPALERAVRAAALAGPGLTP